MLHTRNVPASVDGFKKLALSDRMRRLMDRVRAMPDCRAATIAEAKAVMAVARVTLPGLMGDDIVEKLIRHNPDVLQIVSGQGIPADKTVFNGLIPLTEAGAEALIAGRFSALDPDLSLIARQGERPAAIYSALVFTPAAFGPAMKALTYWVGRMAPEGCPLFTRAVTDHTRSLVPAMGFVRADTLYPTAPADLLVVVPEAEVASGAIDEKRLPAAFAPMPEPGAEPRLPDSRVPEPPSRAPAPVITVRVARSMEDMMKVFTIRAATYMSEQACPYDEEFDGNDFCAMHLLGEIDGEPVGCLRMRFFGDFVKMERLAVRGEYRATKLAFRMVREGIDICRRKGFRHIYGHARTDLVRFWSVFGFRPIADRPRFTFSGVEYVEMEGPVPADPARVAVGTDPLVIIRPEGAWDRPGPLDRSAARGVDDQVAGQMRRIGGGRGR